jgi:hypothetical protein
VGTTMRTPLLSIILMSRWLEDRWWAVGVRMRGMGGIAMTAGHGGDGDRLAEGGRAGSGVVHVAAEMYWQGAGSHEGVVRRMAMHVRDRREAAGR